MAGKDKETSEEVSVDIEVDVGNGVMETIKVPESTATDIIPADKSVATGDDDDEHEGSDDARLDAEAGDDREAIRERRRGMRKRKRDRQRQELSDLRQQVDTLHKQLGQVHTGNVSNEIRAGLANIDNQLGRAQSAYSVANEAFAVAISKGTEGDISEALRLRDEAMLSVSHLANQRQAAIQQAKQMLEGGRRQAAAPAEKEPPAAAQNQAMKWIDRNPWYDKNGSDAVSRKVLALDEELEEDGYDAGTRDYWDELDRRIGEAMPGIDNMKKVFTGDDAKTKPARRSPPVGGRGSATGGGTVVERTLSPARVAAMKEAGIWDDPKRRDKMIKNYVNYDRNARSA